jgi:hypothetical protein
LRSERGSATRSNFASQNALEAKWKRLGVWTLLRLTAPRSKNQPELQIAKSPSAAGHIATLIFRARSRDDFKPRNSVSHRRWHEDCNVKFRE